MNAIKCYGHNESLYHLLKITDHKIEQDAHVITESGHAIITGFHKGEISTGDAIILSPQGVNYIIQEVIERRNHAGVFKNPEDKKDSFFKVKTNFFFKRAI